MEHNLEQNMSPSNQQLLSPSDNMTESEEFISSNTADDLLEIFESQLQQTVHLVDLMHADQKSRALASMYCLLSKKLPDPSGTTKNQGSVECSERGSTKLIPQSEKEVLGMLPDPLLHDDSEDNPPATLSSRAETVDPPSVERNLQTSDKIATNKVEDSVSSRGKHNSSVNCTDITVNKEKSVQSDKMLSLSDGSKQYVEAEVELMELSRAGSDLPPKKRGRVRHCKDSTNHGMNIMVLKNSKECVATSDCTERQRSVDEPSLRRSTRERKISSRVIEYLGPKTALLKSVHSEFSEAAQPMHSKSEKQGDAITTLKRGRGRPARKIFNTVTSLTCVKLEKDEMNSAAGVGTETADGIGLSGCQTVNDVKPVLCQNLAGVTDILCKQPGSDVCVQSSKDEPSSPDDIKFQTEVTSMTEVHSDYDGSRTSKVDKDNLIDHQKTVEIANQKNIIHSPTGYITVTDSEENQKAHMSLNLNQNSQNHSERMSAAINNMTDGDKVTESQHKSDDLVNTTDESQGSVQVKVESTEENAKGICMDNLNQYIVRENNRFRCTVCGKLANYKANLKVHLRIHSGEKPFKCAICKKSFAASNNLQRHINETHEKKRPFICETCGQGCFTQKSLVRHQLKKHSPEETSEKPKFICETCGKCFKWRSDLKDHSVKHTNAMPFKCETCGRAFTFLNNLRRHRKIHKDYRPHKCQHCGKRFIEPRCLRLHMNRVHLGIDVKPQGEPKYICEVCKKPFYMKSWLDLHMLSHTGYKPHACTMCDRKFSLKANLKRHMLTHTGENPFTCTECQKKFKSKRALKLHIMIHRNEKPFICDLCQKGFTNKSALKEHLLIHDSEPRFACKICNQTFLRVSHLQLHMERHEGKPRHTCDKCSAKFYRKCDLNRHLLKHSNIKPYCCLWCSKHFTRKQYLSNHIKTSHPILGKDNQMKKVLLHVMPLQHPSRPLFRIVPKHGEVARTVVNEADDVSTLLKLTNASTDLVATNESGLDQLTHSITLPQPQAISVAVTTVSDSVGYDTAVADGVAYDTIISDSVAYDAVCSNAAAVVNEGLDVMSKVAIGSHPDPLQCATSMLFESGEEEAGQSAGLMTGGSPAQYITIQEDFSALPSDLKTIVNSVAERQQQQQEESLMTTEASENKCIVLTFAGSDHIVMVTSAEDGSVASPKALDHLERVNSKTEQKTSDLNDSADDEVIQDSQADMIGPGDGTEVNMLPHNVTSNASLIEIDSQEAQHFTGALHTVATASNVTTAADALSTQGGEHVFMETVSSSFSSSLEQDGLVLGPYSQADNQTVIHGEAQYHEVIMPNGERMQLLIQGTDMVHNIKVSHDSDGLPEPEGIQVIGGSAFEETTESPHSSAASQELTETELPQGSEIIYGSNIIQESDPGMHGRDDGMKNGKTQTCEEFEEGQYLVILKQ